MLIDFEREMDRELGRMKKLDLLLSIQMSEISVPCPRIEFGHSIMRTDEFSSLCSEHLPAPWWNKPRADILKRAIPFNRSTKESKQLGLILDLGFPLTDDLVSFRKGLCFLIYTLNS